MRVILSQITKFGYLVLIWCFVSNVCRAYKHSTVYKRDELKLFRVECIAGIQDKAQRWKGGRKYTSSGSTLTSYLYYKSRATFSLVLVWVIKCTVFYGSIPIEDPERLTRWKNDAEIYLESFDLQVNVSLLD